MKVLCIKATIMTLVGIVYEVCGHHPKHKWIQLKGFSPNVWFDGSFFEEVEIDKRTGWVDKLAATKTDTDFFAAPRAGHCKCGILASNCTYHGVIHDNQ